jgi:hydrogenase maturation protein HypF
LSAEWKVPLIQIQHHHAHAAAVMCECGMSSALALVYDGTGLGPDGTLWGGELLHVFPGGYARLGTLAGVPLPGGEAAIQRPVRQLVARWIDAGLTVDDRWCDRLRITPAELDVWRLQVGRGVNCPISHGAGRLFDAFAAALGLADDHITYDGQAAIRLEAAAGTAVAEEAIEIPYAVQWNGAQMEVSFKEAFAALATPPVRTQIPALAAGFHCALVDVSLAFAVHGRAMTGCHHVVLCGGVMMNRRLSSALVAGLTARGFTVYEARIVPPGDGGIAVGQVVAAEPR